MLVHTDTHVEERAHPPPTQIRMCAQKCVLAGCTGTAEQLENPPPPPLPSSPAPCPLVIVCRCNVEGQCMRKVGRMKGMPTKLSAVGILVGTLMAIGNGC